jgi:hypothetical protein
MAIRQSWIFGRRVKRPAVLLAPVALETARPLELERPIAGADQQEDRIRADVC